MNIEVILAGHAERLIVRNLMELYQHDFSELDGTDLDEHGQYGYPDLDCFWNHPGHAAHVIKVDGKWAGFALTNQEVYMPGSTHAIVEFFVVRKYRRLGVGQHAAQAIMQDDSDDHPFRSIGWAHHEGEPCGRAWHHQHLYGPDFHGCFGRGCLQGVVTKPPCDCHA